MQNMKMRCGRMTSSVTSGYRSTPGSCETPESSAFEPMAAKVGFVRAALVFTGRCVDEMMNLAFFR